MIVNDSGIVNDRGRDNVSGQTRGQDTGSRSGAVPAVKVQGLPAKTVTPHPRDDERLAGPPGIAPRAAVHLLPLPAPYAPVIFNLLRRSDTRNRICWVSVHWRMVWLNSWIRWMASSLRIAPSRQALRT